jgi:UDP-N-acetylmuramoylalanine--D-glutamate ligase
MKIALIGLGRSGLSVYKYLKQNTEDTVYLVNSGRPNEWPCFDIIKDDLDRAFSDEIAIKELGAVDQIVLSPGIPRDHIALTFALKNSVPIISEIEFAFLHSDIPVVGITGTNGKTTTTTMIGDFLNQLAIKAFVGGNIGIPYTDILSAKVKYEVAIIELSSFQLESIDTFKPTISLLLNVSENHMERYKSFSDYKAAKERIFLNQDADCFAIVNKVENRIPKEIEIKPLENFSFEKSKLVGVHNKLNFFCAYNAAKLLTNKNIDKEFQQFIDNFTGVEFRLQYICEKNGITFYNDAKSTNTDATASAINAFNFKENLSIIIGGKLRDDKITIQNEIDFSPLQTVYCFGEARDLLSKNIKSSNTKNFETLDQVFEDLLKNKTQGIVLFSPGFPSFDQYKNYEHRGQHFNKLCTVLKETH